MKPCFIGLFFCRMEGLALILAVQAVSLFVDPLEGSLACGLSEVMGLFSVCMGLHHRNRGASVIAGLSHTVLKSSPEL